MRKILISLLLAGAAATPAIAGPNNWSDRQQAQEDRQQAHQDRQQARDERQQAREERQSAREEQRANFNGGQFNGNARPDRVNVQQQSVNAERFNGRPDRGNFAGRYDGNENVNVAPGPRAVTPGQARDQRVRDRDLRQSDRPTPNVVRSPHPPIVSDTPRPGTQPPLRTEGRRGGEVHWNTNWRNNGHYDWHRYRDHHHSLFHLGLYYDPFGWGYQPFSIGWRLWPAYYGNQYWIDPGLYQLPYPPPGAMWVRYWNDALLVDMYTGTVIDVIPGFFW
jgi:Ni/Co efflux regulator RcnB